MHKNQGQKRKGIAIRMVMWIRLVDKIDSGTISEAQSREGAGLQQLFCMKLE